MADLNFLAVTVAFFTAATAFVALCDRIIGPDSDHGSPQGTGEGDDEPVEGNAAGAAGTSSRTGRDDELAIAGGAR